jgi:2-C-methyl-D-erythritol 4-phosphate cytidylyltransferase
MHVTAIIAAGGRGQRFGAAQPKQLISVGGRPILERSVDAFASHPSVDSLVVALPQMLVDHPPAYLRSANTAGLREQESVTLSGKTSTIVHGGDQRQDSVVLAFQAAGDAADVIVIHDAARPFVSADLIARTIAAAIESGAAVAAVQSRDTVKLARRESHDARLIAETLPRQSIYLAQTPQAFQRDVLRRALEVGGRANLVATDEASLVELAGLPVRIVDGEASNIKITTPDDLLMAEAIAAQSAMRATSTGNLPARTGRAGTGYDLHRLETGRPLILGGVTIPSDRGALGHSDADVSVTR